MPTLKVKPDNVTALPGRGDYVFGDNQELFLRPDWDFKTVLRFFEQLNEPLQVLDVRLLERQPWNALRKVVKDGLFEVRAMQDKADYLDCYTELHTPSLLPQFLLSTDTGQYAHAEGYTAGQLEMATLEESEFKAVVGSYDNQAAWGPPLVPGRVQQVLIGTGYSRSFLPTDGDSHLAWQFTELTNGDVVMSLGYEWFNK